jgi:hypothetical protein
MSIKYVSELPGRYAFIVSSARENTQSVESHLDTGDYITLHIGQVQITMPPANWVVVQETIAQSLKALPDVSAPPKNKFRIVFDDATREASVVSL